MAVCRVSTTMTRCLVITRDRVSYTRLCIASLEQHPDLDIHLVDHGSTWGPMLDYLDGSPHPVWRRGDHPPRSLWEWDRLGDLVRDQRYVVTDPDVVLDCPTDWLERLNAELDCGGMVKVGLGLRIDDLPKTRTAHKVRAWEIPFWMSRRPSGAWNAPVDTTLALYPPLTAQPGFHLVPAARLDKPYLIRHLPWYGDLDPAETEHYRQRIIPGSSHWINGGW